MTFLKVKLKIRVDIGKRRQLLLLFMTKYCSVQLNNTHNAETFLMGRGGGLEEKMSYRFEDWGQLIIYMTAIPPMKILLEQRL